MNTLEVITPPGTSTVTLIREFDAPPQLVFDVMTDPALINEWWGPGSHTTVIHEMEVRPGGRWHFSQTDPHGSEFGFHGVYHDVVAGERVVQTFEYEGMPGHVSLETTTLNELPGGRTRMVNTTAFTSIEDRDGMVDSGMEQGAAEGLDRLEAYLATRQ